VAIRERADVDLLCDDHAAVLADEDRLLSVQQTRSLNFKAEI